MVETVDAVVIGAGHNGLVSAAVLADAGWDVLVLEERDVVGGAVGSVVRDGWVMDECSACHPLAAASPVLRSLDLAAHGLRWARADPVVVHPDGPADPDGATLWADPARTAAGLGSDADGQAWLELVALWRRVRDPLLGALLTRWPPVRDTARLLAAVGLRDTPELLRFLTLSVSRMGREQFEGTAGRLLLAGNAMHADIAPDGLGSGLYGWLLAMLAQDVGFPSPEGGTARLADALQRRAERAGAEVRTGDAVVRVEVVAGRAVGVRTAGGRSVRARRAVVADVSAPALYGRLLAQVPAGLVRALGRFEWDLPTVKLNYRLARPLPWTARGGRAASVLHVGADLPGLHRWWGELAAGRVPPEPFALVGQMSTIDPSRSPAGTEAMWLYTHLPRGVTDDASATRAVEACERMLDRYAPGWRDLVLDRWVQRPSDLFATNANLGPGGAINGGTAAPWQQLVLRPVPGLGGPRTFVTGLYLGSAAIHPGGGVHGGCGYLAARAALTDQAWWGAPVRWATTAALRGMWSAVGAAESGQR